MNNRVIVIGVSHHNTLGMVRCLGMAEIRSDLILIGSKSSYITKSRYLDKVYCIEHTEDVLSILFRNYNSSTGKPIIISCTDQVACLLDSNYDNLKNSFIFFNCGYEGTLTKNMDKQIQVNLAEEEGLKVPVSFVYQGDLINILFPCILKPLKSINGGKKIILCNTEEELKKKIINFQSNETVLIQQFIKKEYEIVMLGLSANGQILIPGFIHKYRDHDGGTLYSRLKSVSALDADLIKKCKNFISRMKYEGLFGIEMIYDGKDFYFIEANLRNDATTFSMAIGGVNLPEMYVKIKSENLQFNNLPIVKELNSIVEFNDFKHRKYNNVSFLRWLKQYLGAKCKYYFNIKDPLPFIFAPFKK